MVYFLPIPTRINTTLQGFRVVETTADDVVTISIKGWELNHLFRPNKIKGTLTITPYAFEEANQAVYELMGTIFVPSDDIDMKWSTVMRYSGAKNRYTSGTVYINKNFEI